MKKIDYSQLCEAHTNWCNFNGFKPPGPILATDFLTFVGIKGLNYSMWLDGGGIIKVSDRTAQYVKALTSPHWYALLKAHTARKHA